MSTPINPIVGGLTQAFQLYQMIHSQQAQDRALELDTRRQQQMEEEQQSRKQMQESKLTMELNALGARSMTPSDELEAATGTRVGMNLQRYNTPGAPATSEGGGGLANLPETKTAMLPSFSPSDIKGRLVKAGGQQWVLPTPEEQDARTEDRLRKANKINTDADVVRAGATETARAKAKIAVDQEDMKVRGIEPRRGRNSKR